MLSKSLIQLSVDGWGYVPSLLFTWGQTMVEVMKILTSLKRSQACTATVRAPQPCSRPPLTHAFAGDPGHPPGKSPVKSLFLSPGSWCTKFCCAIQESISQSYVSSGSSMVGLMVTSSKRAYAIPKSAALRAPVPAADHC